MLELKGNCWLVDEGWKEVTLAVKSSKIGDGNKMVNWKIKKMKSK